MWETSHQRRDIRIGGVSLVGRGEIDLVQEVIWNRNIDKSIKRGRTKVKMNHCRVKLHNPDGQLNDLLRAGRTLSVATSYLDSPLIRWGTFRIEEWSRSKAPGQREIEILCLSREVKTAYDKMPADLRNLTHSDAVIRYAKAMGWRYRVTPTPTKVDLQKSALETAFGFLQRVAFNTGFDLYMEDASEDENDDRPVLVFEPPTERPMITVAGRELTVGQGEEGLEAGASLLCQKIKFKRKFPVSDGVVAKRAPDGAPFAIYNRRRGTNRLVSQMTDYTNPDSVAELLSLGAGTEGFGTSEAGRKAKTGAYYASSQWISELHFEPAVPFFHPSHVYQVVGEGDDDGPYRVVDLTLNWGKDGQTSSLVRGLRGAGGKKKRVAADGPTFAIYNRRRGGGRRVQITGE